MTATVSVVMAAYNGAAHLPETLRSLEAQSFTDWELVVVDDCSTDGTFELLQAWPDPRLRLFRSPANGGPVRARNQALEQARGRYVAGLDQDDLCRPDRLRRQVAHLDAHDDLVALGTASTFLEDGRRRMPNDSPNTTPALIEWLLRIENPLIWSSMMIRTEIARRLRPFTRTDRLYAEDFDLYNRLLGHGRIARLDAVLLDYRIHGQAASQRFTDTMHEGAERTLVEIHEPLFGADVARAAALIARHLMLFQPVPDRATLRALGDVVARAQAHYLATRPVDAEDARLIRWETARRWTRIGRAGLRSGTLTLADLWAVRPPQLGLGLAGVESLLMSSAVGAARRLGRSFGQTLAA